MPLSDEQVDRNPKGHDSCIHGAPDILPRNALVRRLLNDFGIPLFFPAPDPSSISDLRSSTPDFRSLGWEHRQRMIILVNLDLDTISWLNCAGLHGGSVGM